MSGLLISPYAAARLNYSYADQAQGPLLRFDGERSLCNKPTLLWERIHSRKVLQTIKMRRLYGPLANEFAPTVACLDYSFPLTPQGVRTISHAHRKQSPVLRLDGERSLCNKPILLWERIHSRKVLQTIKMRRLYCPLANEFAPQWHVWITHFPIRRWIFRSPACRRRW